MEKIDIDENKADRRLIRFGDQKTFRCYQYIKRQDPNTLKTLHRFLFNPNDPKHNILHYYPDYFTEYTDEDHPGDYIIDKDTKRKFLKILVEDKYVYDWGSNPEWTIINVATTPIGETNTPAAIKIDSFTLQIDTLEAINKSLQDENQKMRGALSDVRKSIIEEIKGNKEIYDAMKGIGSKSDTEGGYDLNG